MSQISLGIARIVGIEFVVRMVSVVRSEIVSDPVFCGSRTTRYPLLTRNDGEQFYKKVTQNQLQIQIASE
jgi:hypothetical protein